MASKKYDLAVKVGEYEKNGETKNRYENIGAVMQGDNGPFILLKRSFNPAGVPHKGDNIIISCFEPQDRDGGQQQPQQRQASNGGGNGVSQRPAQSQGGQRQTFDLDDEIPF